ncbi:MAG: hypothetical protein C4330_13405, partial [Chitinophagaceae bacterium]
MRKLLLLSFLFSFQIAFSQKLATRFETSNGTESPAYPEIIDWWKKLDATSSYVKMMEFGATDAGFPLHVVLISSDKNFDIKSIRAKNKAVILINKGIHPGEPDGIDASMLLAKEIVVNQRWFLFTPYTYLPFCIFIHF